MTASVQYGCPNGGTSLHGSTWGWRRQLHFIAALPQWLPLDPIPRLIWSDISVEVIPMRPGRWLAGLMVGLLLAVGWGQWAPVGGTEPAGEVPPPLVVYQPVQRLVWEGLYETPQGRSYFAPDARHDFLFSYFDSDLDIARQSGDRVAEAEALLNLGLARHLGGSFYTEAETYYEEGLAVAATLSDRTWEIMFLGNLSLLHLQNSLFYRDTVDRLEQLYSYTWPGAYYYAGTDPTWVGKVLGNLGKLYFGADYYGRALDTHQQRLALARELGDTAGEAQALGDLGTVYQGLGDYATAIDYHQQQLALGRQRQDDRAIAQALSSLGIAAHSQGNYAQARDYQQQFLQFARDRSHLLWQEQALANLAGAYLFLGDTDRAIALYEEALAIADRLAETQMRLAIRNNLGLVYQQRGDLDQSRQVYQRSISAAYIRDNPQALATALNNLGATEMRAGNWTAASVAFYGSLIQLESARGRLGGNDAHKVSLFETQRFPYDNLQSLLLAQDQPSAALEVAERGRAQVFADLLNRRLGSSRRQHTDSADFRVSLHFRDMVTLARDRQATLVEYALLSAPGNGRAKSDRLIIWVIHPDGTLTARQIRLGAVLPTGTDSLEALVQVSRAAVGVRGLGIAAIGNGLASQVGTAASADANLRLQPLADLLIAPIADLLPSDPDQPVIIVPQGELFLVPFAALPLAAGGTMVDQHTLVVVPSLQVLRLTAQLDTTPPVSLNSRAAGGALVVGNPQMPQVPPQFGTAPQPLPALPGTEAEAIAIAQLLNIDPLLGGAATETAVKQRLRSARLVHLATHGLLDETQGLESAIALAPSSQDDGLLTAAELLELAVPADLVVLSACDTGRGRITGDGVIGLSRSLLAAGVPRLVVSLWQVPDQPTADLMTAFYAAMQQGQDPAHSLRTAMLQTRDRHPQVGDWAGFVVVGDGTRL